MSNYNIHNGDCFEVIKDIDDNSVESVITDSPYGISFMEEWDDFTPKKYQEWCEEWSKECKRVLKPGGYLLAFSSKRTHHRLFTGVEDAGYKIKDTLTWHYGSGFPKGQELKKSIERWSDKNGDNWSGWNTQLKPSTEFIVLAQKPISEDAIYKNVLKHGTGALNIDRCRVPTSNDEHKQNHPDERGDSVNTNFQSGGNSNIEDGRYPSNLLLSDTGQKILDDITDSDEQTEKRKQSDVNSSDSEITHKDKTGSLWNKQDYDGGLRQYGDGGGKSRYFPKFSEPRFCYEAKASKSERTHGGNIDNDHPTVKPVDLMRWLVRLVTKQNQTVLDIFMGSGTTGIACIRENRNFIGIEKDEEYYNISSERLDYVQDN